MKSIFFVFLCMVVELAWAQEVLPIQWTARNEKFQQMHLLAVSGGNALVQGGVMDGHGYPEQVIWALGNHALPERLGKSVDLFGAHTPIAWIENAGDSISVLSSKPGPNGTTSLWIRHFRKDLNQAFPAPDSLGTTSLENFSGNLYGVSPDKSRIIVAIPTAESKKTDFSMSLVWIDLEQRKIVKVTNHQLNVRSRNIFLDKVLVTDDERVYILGIEVRAASVEKSYFDYNHYFVLSLDKQRSDCPRADFPSEGRDQQELSIALGNNQELMVYGVWLDASGSLAKGVHFARFQTLADTNVLPMYPFSASLAPFVFNNMRKGKIQGVKMHQLLSFPGGEVALVMSQSVLMPGGGIPQEFQKSILLARFTSDGRLRWMKALPASILQEPVQTKPSREIKLPPFKPLKPLFDGCVMISGDSLGILYNDHPKNLLVPRKIMYARGYRKGSGVITFAVIGPKGNVSRTHINATKQSKSYCPGSNMFLMGGNNVLLFGCYKGSKKLMLGTFRWGTS